MRSSSQSASARAARIHSGDSGGSDSRARRAFFRRLSGVSVNSSCWSSAASSCAPGEDDVSFGSAGKSLGWPSSKRGQVPARSGFFLLGPVISAHDGEQALQTQRQAHVAFDAQLIAEEELLTGDFAFEQRHAIFCGHGQRAVRSAIARSQRGVAFEIHDPSSAALTLEYELVDCADLGCCLLVRCQAFGNRGHDFLRAAHGAADAVGATVAEAVGRGFAACRPGGRGWVGGVVGTAVAVGAVAVAVTNGGFVAVAGGVAVAVVLATAGGALSAGFSVVM